jgi:thiol:disulfide interchange protein
MKLLLLRAVLAVLFGAVVLVSSSFGQKPPPPSRAGVLDPIIVKTDLYPADADAKKEIAAALKLAATDHKRVLLVFGANWCYDCHVLDRALHEGAAGQVVKESFLLAHVDIGEVNKNLDLAKQYKIPLEKGVPAIAILGSDGKLLYSSGDGEFEAARRMMKKDLVRFLNRWRELPLQNRER